MWAHLTTYAAEVPPDTGDKAVQVALIGGTVTIVVTLIGALVTLLRRDGNRTEASPPAPSEESPTMLALVQSIGDRLDDLAGRVNGLGARITELNRKVERYESRRNHPSGGGPS